MTPLAKTRRELVERFKGVTVRQFRGLGAEVTVARCIGFSSSAAACAGVVEDGFC